MNQGGINRKIDGTMTKITEDETKKMAEFRLAHACGPSGMINSRNIGLDFSDHDILQASAGGIVD